MHEKKFSEAVRKIVLKIPSGKVTTYGRLAAFVGSSNAAQASTGPRLAAPIQPQCAAGLSVRPW